MPHLHAASPPHAQSIAAGPRKHGFCAGCHGINGRWFKVIYPILAGQAKRGEILRCKSPLEMDLMRRIKAALDPQGIMNPGKVP